MAEKAMKTQPFQSGQNTNAWDKGEKTVLKSNMSKKRNVGQPDQLSQVLAGRDSYIPSGMHVFVPSGSVSYSPAGEFGKPTSKEGYKATNPMGRSGGKGTFRGQP